MKKIRSLLWHKRWTMSCWWLQGYALRFNIEEVPVVGARAAGVGVSISRKTMSAFIANTDSAPPDSNAGTQAHGGRRYSERSWSQVLRELRPKPHRVFVAGPVFTAAWTLTSLLQAEASEEQILQVLSNKGTLSMKSSVTASSLSERTSNGGLNASTV